MKVTKTPFEGLLILEPRVFSDERGYFFESFNMKAFSESTGLAISFVQDNQSHSSRGVLRGMHFQKPPFAQSKLVRVLQGSIQDVAVDLRSSSPTFGKHFSIELSASNNLQLFIPKGFAHGFLVLSETANVFYKCDEYYHAEAEGGVRYDNPSIGIEWAHKVDERLISKKDLELSFSGGPDTPF